MKTFSARRLIAAPRWSIAAPSWSAAALGCSATAARLRPAALPSIFSATRTALVAGAALILGLSSIGCGNTLYLVEVNNAEEDLQEAKELGAERYAPYEYYAAEARLDEAKEQAAQAEYGNASQLSDEASILAESAIVKSKKARDARGAPLQRTGAPK